MAENSDWYAAAVVGIDSSLLFSEKTDFFHAGRALECSFYNFVDFTSPNPVNVKDMSKKGGVVDVQKHYMEITKLDIWYERH